MYLDDSDNAFFCVEEPDFSIGPVVVGCNFNDAEHKGLITNIYSKSLRDLAPDDLLAGGYQTGRLLSYELAMQNNRFVEGHDIISIVCFTIPSECTGNLEDDFKPLGYARCHSSLRLAI